MTPEKLNKRIGKFQITLILKEFVDMGDSIDIKQIGAYEESCWSWDEAKESIIFFIKRIEEKLNGKD